MWPAILAFITPLSNHAPILRNAWQSTFTYVHLHASGGFFPIAGGLCDCVCVSALLFIKEHSYIDTRDDNH